MTRLAAVLAGAMTEIWTPAWRLEDAEGLVAAIPEPERSALEAALEALVDDLPDLLCPVCAASPGYPHVDACSFVAARAALAAGSGR